MKHSDDAFLFIHRRFFMEYMQDKEVMLWEMYVKNMVC